MSDPRLEALLHDLPPPPPVPEGLKARVLAAAGKTPQEAYPAPARRIAARRDPRGGWLRRPLLAGTAALGLVFTSAVAATLAGVPIPQKIAAVFFPETKAPQPKAAPAPRRAARAAAAPVAAPVERAEAEPTGPIADAIFRPNARPWRRLMMAQRVIEARRAMGLPTPRADRIERQLQRQARMWDEATPEQRARWIQRREERQAERRALLATPEGRAVLAEQRAERKERFLQWREARRARWQASNGRDPVEMQQPERRARGNDPLEETRAASPDEGSAPR